MNEVETKVKIEITSKPVELLFETAKGFLEKVVNPPLEQIGLLLSDKIMSWRFKNQIDIIVKVEEYLKSKNIEPQKISLKVLAPLLEFSSLEEEERLQQKWVALLANTVSNNESNTTLFSYILSQISTKDAEIFELIFENSVSKGSRSTIAFGHKVINVQEMRKRDSLTIDNLDRLKLIKPVLGYDSGDIYMITTLGVSFMQACTLK